MDTFSNDIPLVPVQEGEFIDVFLEPEAGLYTRLLVRRPASPNFHIIIMTLPLKFLQARTQQLQQ